MTSLLTTHLNTLTATLKSTTALITRLSTLTFQPGSEPLSSTNSTSVRLELAQDIHDSLKQLEEDLELLKQEAEDLAPGNSTAVTAGSFRGRRESTSEAHRERGRVNAQIARLGEDLRSARAQFRRAQLSAKKNAEKAKQVEREAVFASLRAPPPDLNNNTNTIASDKEPADPTSLFASRRTTTPKPSTKSAEQQELDATTTITQSLRRTHALLTTELSRSRFAQETFDASTAALADLGEKYTNLDTLLTGSRELLGTLLRSQKSDTWYLETAFYILCATAGWLVFRRILLGPFVRLPLFLINWLVWKPLVGVVYFSGVFKTDGGASSLEGKTALTRTPLIVQPSAAASGGIPQFDEAMAEQMRKAGGVPVGAGGANAKAGKDGDAGSMSERIARMAEEAERRDQGPGGKEEEEQSVGDDGPREDETRRGDGTVLQDRGDEPPNPRKKVFEADVEDARYREQVQGHEQQQQEGERRRRRDEL